MAAPSKDRLLTLLASTTLNGIDFVEVRDTEPKNLFVHFVNTVVVDQPGLTAAITGGDRIPQVAVGPINTSDWTVDNEGRPLLTLNVAQRGDFSTYWLTVAGGDKLDPYFRHVSFSFFAFCPSLVDCKPPDPECPPVTGGLPPIDYLAKDFLSFRQALSSFSALRYPNWRERSEADLGMAFLELLSAVGDDLSYFQDRIQAESAIDTASQRRSIVRLARLVDYEPRPATASKVLLQCDVTGASVPAGVLVTVQSPDGTTIPFEVGFGLADTSSYTVNPLWNAGIKPYYFDDRDRCLRAGSTEMFVEGHGFGFSKGQQLVLDTQALTTADPPVRELVTLATDCSEETDPLFNVAVTRIQWTADDALQRDHDLTRTLLAGNLIPATQGRRYSETFAIATAPLSSPNTPLAVARMGANSTPANPVWDYFYTLRNSSLAYLDQDGKPFPEPEIILTLQGTQPRVWEYTRTLLQAGLFEEKYTIEQAAFVPIARFEPPYAAAAGIQSGTVYDYDGDSGFSVRFGNGFGEPPNDGDVYEVRYRVELGSAGNVAPDTITGIDVAWSGVIASVTNPFAACGGADAETNDQVRRRAPQAFRATTYRAVRTEDYQSAAETLNWVQRAGTVFRWTGSWPTVFTTIDPKSATELTHTQHLEAVNLLNRYRLAGYESYVPSSRFVSFDIQIRLCAEPEAFQGDVRSALMRALNPVRYVDGTLGFFHVDNFTLGTSFERSKLEAAIQSVAGVAGILSIKFRRRGFQNTFVEMPGTIALGPGEIFRMDNNMNRPERGSFRVQVEGGK